MAKKMSNGAFTLEASAEKNMDGSPKIANYDIVQSAIYTLKLDVEGGKVRELGKEDLINKDQRLKGDGSNNYRFQNITVTPKMPDYVEGGNLSKDQLTNQIGWLCDAIEQYDGSDQIVTTDGRNVDRKIYIVPRATDAQGNVTKDPAMTTAQYVAQAVYRAIRLDAQKNMQAPLRDEAERVMREELSLPAPVGKPKRAKLVTGGAQFDPMSLVK